MLPCVCLFGWCALHAYLSQQLSRVLSLLSHRCAQAAHNATQHPTHPFRLFVIQCCAPIPTMLRSHCTHSDAIFRERAHFYLPSPARVQEMRNDARVRWSAHECVFCILLYFMAGAFRFFVAVVFRGVVVLLLSRCSFDVARTTR